MVPIPTFLKELVKIVRNEMVKKGSLMEDDLIVSVVVHLLEQLNGELSDSLGRNVDSREKQDRIWALRAAIRLCKKQNPDNLGLAR